MENNQQESEILKMHHARGSAAEAKIAKLFTDYPNRRIQESIFTSLFLPMFVGGGPFMDVDAWRGYAGSLINEVDVFTDITDDSTYLYTVPPLQLETRSVISDRGPTGMMGNTLSGALINRADEPTDPEVFALIGSQVARAEEMVIDKSEEYLARWDAIFKRYGIDYKEVRKEVGRLKFGIDVKDDISNQSSKKGGLGWGPELNEEIEFDVNGDDSY